jgi:hypothetical protein
VSARRSARAELTVTLLAYGAGRPQPGLSVTCFEEPVLKPRQIIESIKDTFSPRTCADPCRRNWHENPIGEPIKGNLYSPMITGLGIALVPV